MKVLSIAWEGPRRGRTFYSFPRPWAVVAVFEVLIASWIYTRVVKMCFRQRFGKTICLSRLALREEGRMARHLPFCILLLVEAVQENVG